MAPSAQSPSTASRPIPRLAPVTTQALPASRVHQATRSLTVTWPRREDLVPRQLAAITTAAALLGVELAGSAIATSKEFWARYRR